MKAGLADIIATAACLVGLGALPAAAEIDLVLTTEAQELPLGARFDVAVYAVSDDGTDQEFSAVDVGFTWDPAVLTLVRGTPGPHAWTLSGFLPDPNLDGINDSLIDGDARYTVLSITPVIADADGFLVATFRFDAVGTSEGTDIVIEPTLGPFSPTTVFGTGQVNEDVTGTLGALALTVAADAMLSVADLTMVPGRIASLVASGEIAGEETFGLTLVIMLVPRDDTVGTVEFTSAPPSDIVPLGDPWPLVEAETAFDTDATPSSAFNGYVDDSGEGAAPVTFSGELAAFPVVASGDALGTWDARLTYYDGSFPVEGFERSRWQDVVTGMRHAVLTVTNPGDGDASGFIDIGDFADFQACFTGPVGPVDPPGYPQAPGMHCGVYDFDGDGDIDPGDYQEFEAVMLGPLP